MDVKVEGVPLQRTVKGAEPGRSLQHVVMVTRPRAV